MKPKCLAVVVGVAPLIACTKPALQAPAIADVETFAPRETEPLPPPDPPREVVPRFPAGPGVTLMSDQFQAVLREPRFRDRNATFAEKLAVAEQRLGKGEEIHESVHDGFLWRGISARTMVAPFGCQEFILTTKGWWTTRPGDHRKCGLPYAADATKPFNGPAPKRTAYRLEEILGEAGTKSPATAVAYALMKLGAADEHGENGEERWAGIAGRGKDAPITCRVLSFGGRPRVEEAPLSHCSLSWPMPGMTFAPGADEPPLDKGAKLDECSNKCSTSEICLLDQRVPATASVRRESDGERARFPDGRAAKAEYVASCVPIPSTCSTLGASCFFPQLLPGQPLASATTNPCPRGTSSGYAFAAAPTPHIMCFARVGP